jgi:hypothetical protein
MSIFTLAGVFFLILGLVMWVMKVLHVFEEFKMTETEYQNYRFSKIAWDVGIAIVWFCSIVCVATHFILKAL